jgi:hypothetical protein
MAKINIQLDRFTEAQRPTHQYSSAAAEAGAVIETRGCCLSNVVITNPTGGALYAQIHDLAAAPTAGDVPILSLLVPAGGTLSDAELNPVLTTGLAIYSSSTAGTFTASGTLLIFAQVRVA